MVYRRVDEMSYRQLVAFMLSATSCLHTSCARGVEYMKTNNFDIPVCGPEVEIWNHGTDWFVFVIELWRTTWCHVAAVVTEGPLLDRATDEHVRALLRLERWATVVHAPIHREHRVAQPSIWFF